MAGVILEYLLGGHRADGVRYAGPHKVNDASAPDEVHPGDYNEPHQQGTAADDKGILQTYYISKAEHRGAGVELEHHLRLVGYRLADAEYRRRDGLAPGPDGRDEEVVNTAYETAHEQGLRPFASGLAADEHLRRRRRLRERVFPVHFLYEVFAERDQEQDPQDASKQGGNHHLGEVDRELRVFVLEDIYCRQGEYRARHHSTGAASDGLDDDVLAERALFAQGAAHTDGDYRYRDRRFEHLADLQSEVGRRRGEYDDHNEAHHYRIRGHFRVILERRQEGLVLLAGLKLPLCVFRERDFLFFFHIFTVKGIQIYI